VGDGPVAVENVLEHSDVVAGVLKYHQGREYLCLANRGLTPCVGDLIVLVDEISVSHLNTVEVLSLASTPMITHPPLCLSVSVSLLSLASEVDRGSRGSPNEPCHSSLSEILSS
jgi:hypothetical protein